MRLLRLSVLGLVLASLGAIDAEAQDAGETEQPAEELSEEQRTALARDRFNEGVGFARREQWQEASARFGRALELRQTPQIRYNLAESLFHLGRLVEASEHVAILESSGDLPRAVSSSLGSLRERIEARVGRLTLHVEGAGPGTRVTLDGRDVAPALFGAPQPVDPGPHVARVWQGDREVVSEEVVVAAGETAELALDVPTAPSARDAALAGGDGGGPLGEGGATEDDSGGIGPWWLWTAVAVVLVGGGVAAYLLLNGDEDPTQGDFMPGVLEVP